MKKPFYITTTLPYVNASPHVGFAMEVIRADVVARYKELMGYEVFFNTGTDEHGQKIWEKAQETGEETQAYVDRYATEFKELVTRLGLLETVHFVRTTDPDHKKAAQEMWRRCRDNGFIYKDTYQAKYCVGCELEKTDSELVDGRCPIHPNRELERIDEENYFFKFSAFGEKLLALYAENPEFVTPSFRFNEIKAFVERGLQDFSISRQKEKMAWGVPVPDEPDHVMYVWFDALTNYISTLGWPEEDEKFESFWQGGTPTQYCGKDNLRQQSAMWQAMLMAAGLPASNKVVINGFINGPDGQKMSKSLGNVLSPFEIIEEFADVTAKPQEVLRYYLTRHVNSFEDSNMGIESVHEAYRAHLVNGIGNLASRLMNMVEKYEVAYDAASLAHHQDFAGAISSEYQAAFDSFDLQKAIDGVWARIKKLDEEISNKEPFKLFKSDPDQARADLADMIAQLAQIALELTPFMPQTAKVLGEMVDGGKKPERGLFARI